MRALAISRRRIPDAAVVLWTVSLLSACLGNNSSTPTGAPPPPPPVANTLTVTVDSGPAAATGQINHGYVTVKVCAAGSTTQCATIDHVLLDTDSVGLRLVRSVLTAGGVTLSAETDAQGQAIEECFTFAAGQTWGPVALADVTVAGETAAKLPVQVIDEPGSGTPPPATCGSTVPLIYGVSAFASNGVFGVGVLAQDCGTACANAAAPYQPIYFGCTAAGVCTAENATLAEQVTHPATMFAADNNGIIVNLPNLQNANGDVSVQGEVIFGIATQTDNALPATGLTVLGADANGDFTATFNGSTTVLPSVIDSGTDSYSFYDPSIAACTSGAFNGYYCPAVAPLPVYAVNTGVGTYNASNTVNFAIADPNSFSATAAAVSGLASGGTADFIWGMPFFYGRKIYFGIEGRVSGTYTGPYYAY
jgi:hypothetical protein